MADEKVVTPVVAPVTPPAQAKVETITAPVKPVVEAPAPVVAPVVETVNPNSGKRIPGAPYKYSKDTLVVDWFDLNYK
jgi:hypothetical protein